MSVAIIHEWLTTYAGSEKVVEQIVPVVKPEKLFVLVDHMSQDRPAFLDGLKVETSFLQRLPFSKKKYRGYLSLMPMAVEQFDLSAFDVVISSHHCVSHGVITRPDQPHLVYTHSPMRYAWDLQHQYFQESGLARKRVRGSVAKLLLHYLRGWDYRAGQRPDFFCANSNFIANRIRKFYRREATVIHPPVDVNRFVPGSGCREDFYLTASRMVPYKKVSLIVEAFSRMPNKKLIVIGDGPEYLRIQSEAGPNISFLGYQPDNILKQYLCTATAFVFAAQEDFGILPVEAQACGTPVIALGKGGTAETVIDGVTGVCFQDQTSQSLQAAVERFEVLSSKLSPEIIRRHAEQFSVERFQREFSVFVDRCLEEFGANRHKSNNRHEGRSCTR